MFERRLAFVVVIAGVLLTVSMGMLALLVVDRVDVPRRADAELIVMVGIGAACGVMVAWHWHRCE